VCNKGSNWYPFSGPIRVQSRLRGCNTPDVMTRVLSGADLPATRAHAVGDLVWLVDRDAAPDRRDVA
jgi:hypothetical protein